MLLKHALRNTAAASPASHHDIVAPRPPLSIIPIADIILDKIIQPILVIPLHRMLFLPLLLRLFTGTILLLIVRVPREQSPGQLRLVPSLYQMLHLLLFLGTFLLFRELAGGLGGKTTGFVDEIEVIVVEDVHVADAFDFASLFGEFSIVVGVVAGVFVGVFEAGGAFFAGGFFVDVLLIHHKTIPFIIINLIPLLLLRFLLTPRFYRGIIDEASFFIATCTFALFLLGRLFGTCLFGSGLFDSLFGSSRGRLLALLCSS
mmetsp:Transcript_31486/g.66231  ORF Transcript_31486/g.66231 Transcript_31486/m.66231 type:complete len:260 (-) Transcript_31486:258-1037(-)